MSAECPSTITTRAMRAAAAASSWRRSHGFPSIVTSLLGSPILEERPPQRMISASGARFVFFIVHPQNFRGEADRHLLWRFAPELEPERTAHARELALGVTSRREALLEAAPLRVASDETDVARGPAHDMRDD